MSSFGPAAVLGLIFGFLWGIGCSLAILYSIYLAGYRRAVHDSLLPEKSRRWHETMRKIFRQRTGGAADTSKAQIGD